MDQIINKPNPQIFGVPENGFEKKIVTTSFNIVTKNYSKSTKLLFGCRKEFFGKLWAPGKKI
jgi:hypothetical protein